MGSEQERLENGTSASSSNMADLNPKPLGAKRIRYSMNLIGYWRSEDQSRVGEYERRVFEEQKHFAGRVAKIAKMIVSMVAFEGLQPAATEAFLKGDDVQCETIAVKKSNEEWAICIVIIIVFNIIGFAPVIFASFRIYKHFEALH